MSRVEDSYMSPQGWLLEAFLAANEIVVIEGKELNPRRRISRVLLQRGMIAAGLATANRTDLAGGAALLIQLEADAETMPAIKTHLQVLRRAVQRRIEPVR